MASHCRAAAAWRRQPLALRRRQSRGASDRTRWRHLVSRRCGTGECQRSLSCAGCREVQCGTRVLGLARRAPHFNQAALHHQFFAAAGAVRQRPIHRRALPLRRRRRGDIVRHGRRIRRLGGGTDQARWRRQRTCMDAGKPVQRRRARRQRNHCFRAVRLGILVAGRCGRRRRRFRASLRRATGRPDPYHSQRIATPSCCQRHFSISPRRSY